MWREATHSDFKINGIKPYNSGFHTVAQSHAPYKKEHSHLVSLRVAQQQERTTDGWWIQQVISLLRYLYIITIQMLLIYKSPMYSSSIHASRFYVQAILIEVRHVRALRHDI